jgi:hypothetical protein
MVEEAHEAAPEASSPQLLPLERARPARQPLIPRTLVIGTLVGILLIASVAGASVAITVLNRVNVPALIGDTEGEARTETARAGLEMVVEARRFSSLAKGVVLEQDPLAGATLSRGAKVSVVVSAGTEEFTMPDVVGSRLAFARGGLEGKGLAVKIDTLESEEPSGTILATNPAPGAPVRTGDIVTVTIATAKPEITQTLPYNLGNRTFVIEAAPVPSGEADIVLEVSRRLRSLLEASGAKITVSRSVTDTETSDAARAARAEAVRPAPEAVVGLSATDSESGGMAVRRPSSGSAEFVKTSEELAVALARELSNSRPPVKVTSTPEDPALVASGSTAARVFLGSFGVLEDKADFSDPRWADDVARDIYRTLGEAYGVQ